MKRHRAPLLLSVSCAAAVAVAGALTWSSLMASQRADTTPPVAVGHAADHLPNESATDWVTYADHVVLVSPVAERAIRPTDTELARGEGVIGRELSMRVDRILWSRSSGPAAPKQFDWRAFGWQFGDGNLEDRTPLAAEDVPRLELDHQYILAIRWEAAQCSLGDRVPAQWQGLGADAMIPSDKGIIGQGELEGAYQSLEQARIRLGTITTADSLEDQMTGRTVDDLERVLAETQPQPMSAVSLATGEAC